MRISDWSSDVCSSDLAPVSAGGLSQLGSWDISSRHRRISEALNRRCPPSVRIAVSFPDRAQRVTVLGFTRNRAATSLGVSRASGASMSSCSAMVRSEEHTSELQSLMRISYAVFCLKKKKSQTQI